MENKRIKGAFLFVPILFLALFGTINAAYAQVVRTHNSDNWSGYTALGSGFTQVEASWVVPTVIPTNTSGIQADTTWVGIGGVNNWNLIQAGTEAIVINGKVSYYSWYELLPDYSITTPLRVSPGDSVRTVITETSPNNWLIEIKNNTTGNSWSKTVYYESVKSSVEWIEEAPTHNNSILPINDFKSVTFTSAYAVKDGVKYAANDLPLHAMVLTDSSGKVLAKPAPFTSNSSFTVNSLISANPSSAASAPATSAIITKPVVETFTTDMTSYVPLQTPTAQAVTRPATSVATTVSANTSTTPAVSRATASVLPGTVKFTLAYVMPGQVYVTR